MPVKTVGFEYDANNNVTAVTVDGTRYLPATAPPAMNPLRDRLGFSPGAPIVAGGHDVASDIAVVKSAGFNWLRIDCFDNGNSNVDAVVKAATTAGINVLMILNSNFKGTPAAYASTCTTVVKRYAPMGVHAYELVNEPNGTAANVPIASYLALLPPAISAVKAADPAAKVLAGCLCPMPAGTPQGYYEYGKAIIDSGAQYDVLSVHPYCNPNLPVSQPADWSSWTKMVNLHNYAASKGDTRPMWATEFGSNTVGSNSWSEATEVTAFTQATAFMQGNAWLERLFWFCIRDGVNGFDTYGVVRADGSTKPVLPIMANATK